jgi:hypothetical protein
MPSDERVWLHNREDATPVDQPRQRDERNPSRIVCAARLHLPLHIQCQLLSQEQVLGCELGVGSYRSRDQPQEITGDAQDVRDAAVKQLPSQQVPGPSNRSDRIGSGAAR